MSRKSTYVLFQHGEHPRIYVNPSNKDELSLKGTLVKKPQNRKLSKVPVEQWLLENGTIVTPSVLGQSQQIIKVEEYITTQVEENSMKKSQKITELEKKFSEISEIFAEKEEELKKLKGKKSKTKYFMYVIVAQALVITYKFLPEIEQLLK